MSSSKVQLTTGEKLSFWGLMGYILLSLPFVAVRHFLLPPKDSLGVHRAVVQSFFLGFLTIPPKIRKGMMPEPTTGEIVKQYCDKQKVQHEVVSLPHDAKLHWVGKVPSQGDKIFLYFHGGGYNLAASPGHTPYAARCAAEAGACLAMLEYTLAPERRYPSQLQQAVEALKHVLTLTPPSKIIFGGDSAGGHLSASILSHILHPEKDIDEIKLSENLGGILFVAPFSSFNYNKPSYHENASKDYLTIAAVYQFNGNFAPAGLSEEECCKIPCLSPRDAPAGYWKGAPVSKMLITAGGWEIFRDDVKALAGNLEADCGEETKVEFVEGAKEWHVAPVVDTVFRLPEMTTSKAILGWMGDSK